MTFYKEDYTLVVYYDSSDKSQQEKIERLQEVQQHDYYASTFTVAHDIQTKRGKMLYDLYFHGESLPIAYYVKGEDKIPFDLQQVGVAG